MIGLHRIEGYAIVSADGMIADADGAMPDAIRNDADQKFLQTRDGSGGRPRARTPLARRRSARGAPQAPHRDAPDRGRCARSGATRTRCCGIPRARRSNRRSRRSASATARSPSSAAPMFSACFCRSTTRSISRAPTAPTFRADGRSFREVGAEGDAGGCARAPWPASPARGATSTPQPASRWRRGSDRADDAVRDAGECFQSCPHDVAPAAASFKRAARKRARLRNRAGAGGGARPARPRARSGARRSVTLRPRAIGSRRSPAGEGASRTRRLRLVQDASDALWCFIVQREACGLRDQRLILREYRVPAEVQNRMGAFGAGGRARRGGSSMIS